MTVSGHILLAHPPHWRQRPKWSRRWQTGLGGGVTGAEDRAALAQTPYRTLSYRVLPADLPARERFLADLMAALKSGRAAVPHWGRSSRLASAAAPGATTLTLTDTLWPWAEDDYLVFLEDGAVTLAQVAGVAGAVLTLTDALPRGFESGAHLWPLLFGTPAAEELTSLTDRVGEIELKLTEPSGQGSLGESAACPAPAAGVATASFSVCPSITPSLGAEEGCPARRRLSWTTLAGADGYKVYSAETADGPWTWESALTIEEDGVTRYVLLDVPFYWGEASTQKFYSVTALFGDTETDKAALAVEKNRLERVMRAVQERRWSALDAANVSAEDLDEFIPWPAREHPSTLAAAAYPANGFYDDDLRDWDTANSQPAGTRAAQLVNALRLAFTFGNADPTVVDWVALRYATTGPEGWVGQHFEAPTLLTAAGLGVPGVTTTTANRAAHFAALRAAVCELIWLWCPGYLGDLEARSISTDAETGCAAAQAAANSLWAGAGWSPTSDTPILVQSWAYNTDDEIQFYLDAVKGAGGFDLNNVDRGEAVVLARYAANWINDGSTHYEGAFPAESPGTLGIGIATGGDPTWYETGLAPTFGTAWATPTFGNQSSFSGLLRCPDDGDNENRGWAVDSFMIGVTRSAAVEGGAWDHYA
jgi:hypothetical protein